MILSFGGFRGCSHYFSNVGQKEREIQFVNGSGGNNLCGKIF